jgi:ectoine hydroxylase-related dioxygenase (phytanoyl-CoA dioxygenase family)
MARAGDAAMMLDAAQRRFWERNGYLWLQGFLAPAGVAELARWTEEVGAWPDTPGRWMRYYERAADGGKVLARIENYLAFHEGLDTLLCRGRIGGVLAELLGEPAVVFKDKINMKAAGGAGFAPHQDAPAYVDFGVPFHLTVMAPVDAFTPDNGCLEMAREAAQTAFLPQNPDGTVRDDVVARFTWDPVLAVPGDLIVFDSFVPHRSGPNRSGGARRAHYVTYNRRSDGDRRAAYYDRKRQLFPQECERQPGVDYARIGAQFNLANPFE